MSDRKVSRNASLCRFPIATMADLLVAIDSDPLIGPRQREELRSAVKTYCRWLGKEAREAEVSAELRTVQRQMKSLVLAQCTTKCRTGLDRAVSKGRRANVFSLINRILLRFRADLVDTRRTALLSDWQNLFAAVDDATLRRSCGRFARWCSARGVVPSQVSQQHAEAFATELVELLPARRARQAFVGLCRAWNRTATEHPALWPQVKLDPGDRRNRTVLPIDQINENFLADLEAMLSRFSSPLDLVEGFDRFYEERTIAELRRILLRLYSVAVLQHKPTPIIASLRDLVQGEVVRSILEHYLNRFGTENTKSAGKYAHFLYVVAKNWVKLPEEELAMLRKYRKVLEPKTVGMTDKNRSTLRYFEDSTRVERLLLQGETALRAFLRIGQPRHRDSLAGNTR